MSLKAFHLLFISLSIVLSVAFGMWSASTYDVDGSMVYLALTIGSFVSAIALGLYEAMFLRKCRRLGI